jgi:hypothetical protein
MLIGCARSVLLLQLAASPAGLATCEVFAKWQHCWALQQQGVQMLTKHKLDTPERNEDCATIAMPMIGNMVVMVAA